MRTLYISAYLLLLPFSSAAQSFLAIKDSAYFDNIGSGYRQYSLVAYNPLTCVDSLITIIDTTGYQVLEISDVAAGPSGEIYVLTFGLLNSGAGEACVSLLNTQTGSITCLFNFDPLGFGGNSLVCSADSVLYAAGVALASYDLKTGVGTYHGVLSNSFLSSGDMIFQNEKLYLTGAGNLLMEVNIANPSASVIVASYPQLPPGREVWGIASNIYDCDSSDLFLIVGVNIDNFIQREYDIYSLDFSTQQIGLLCTGAGAYYYTGSTTYNEYLSSDCSVRLDLDKNNSSGADSANYQVAICGSGPVFVSDTSDMELYSGYRIDSLRLKLMPLMPGEALVAGATPATLTLTGQNSPNLIFINPGNVIFSDFQSALRSVYWQYTGGGSPIPGQRTVEVIVFARGGRQDTAVAYLKLISLPQTQESLQRCFGQPYTWNGQVLASDTTICTTFNGLNGCDSTHCLTLDFYYPGLSFDTILCEGQNLLWQGQTYTTGGTFRDTVLLAGCLTALSLQLNIIPNDTIPMAVNICPGETFNIDNQQINMPGEYLLNLPTEAGCDSVIALNLAWWPVSQPQITGDTAFCFGNSTTLSATGFVSYQWSFPGAVQPSLEVTSSGVYTITVTDTNGCTATAAQSVTESAAILASWDLNQPDCAGAANGWIELLNISGGESPFSFRFNGASSVQEPFFDNLAGGMYTIEIQDAVGCASDTLLVLNEPMPLSVSLGPDLRIPPGGTRQLSAQVSGAQGAISYLWSPVVGLSCTDCPNPTVSAVDTIMYTLIVTDANGCTAADSMRISVQSPDFVYVPNVFSPDGDEQNDFFGVFADLDKVQAVELLRVYDRWGSLVYESATAAINDTKTGWDGTFRGKLLAPGIYVWYASIRLVDGSLLQKSGDVLLL